MKTETAASVQAWASVLTAILTIIGLGFVMSQITFAKEQYLAYKEERKSAKMEALYNEWASPPMLSYRSSAAQAYPNGSAHLLEVFQFFERVARAKHHGIVSVEDVDYYFQDAMLTYWCGFEPWVKKRRSASGEDPDTGDLFSGFQSTVVAMKVGSKTPCMSAAEIAMMMSAEQRRYQLLTTLPAPSTAQPPSQGATKSMP